MKTNKRSQTESIADASPFVEEDTTTPTPEEIAHRAYENYETEGSKHGSDVEHWLAAEAGLLAERGI
jgi:hypothetical protein